MLTYIKNNKALIMSILVIAFPAIVEMALNTLVGVADTIMISKFIGNDALSASGFANQLVFTIIFIFSSFNIGATALISRRYGEKDYKKLNHVIGQNMTLNALIGIFITILFIMIGSHIMGIFDMTAKVSKMANSYLNIISYSQFFMFISFAAAASLRGCSNTKTPMIITGLVNIINIIGNYFLITGFWIFPEMGIEGAALSTTISRIIGSLLFIAILVRGKNGIKLKIKNLKLTSEIFNPLCKLSSTAGLEQFLLHTSFLVMSIIISVLDTTSEAAFRILISIESMSFMPAIGFSIASASLIGKSLGEKDKKKAKHIGYISLGLSLIWGVLIGLVFIAFPSIILKAFSNDMVIINKALVVFIYMGINQPFLSFSIVGTGSLRGAGDTKTVMVISALRLWIIFIPLSYVFVRYVHIGILSIWIAEIISFLIFNIVILKRFNSEKWANISV